MSDIMSCASAVTARSTRNAPARPVEPKHRGGTSAGRARKAMPFDVRAATISVYVLSQRFSDYDISTLYIVLGPILGLVSPRLYILAILVARLVHVQHELSWPILLN